MGPVPEMGPAPGMQVRVKNTFLELVEDEEVQPRILKSKTDSLAMRPPYLSCDDAFAAEGNPLPDASACGVAMATAAAAASAALAAARAAAAAAAVPQCFAAGGMPVVPGFGELPPLEALGLASRKPARKPAGRAEKPKQKGAEEAQASAVDESCLTTVMLRNLPNDYSRGMLLELLDASGFAGRYDFVYLPSDFSRRAGLGYAFVNMVSPADAQQVRAQLEGFRQWSVPSGKVCSVGWSNPCQGLEANVERYRNSPILHDSVPDEFKPMVFVGGLRVPFPPPTKKLRRPDLSKHNRQRS